MDWLEAFLANPPRTLDALDRLVGPLDIDWQREARGLFERGNRHAGLVRMVASFRPPFGALAPSNAPLRFVRFELERSPQALLEQQLGRGRELPSESKLLREYGTWFYLDDLVLTYETTRRMFPVQYVPPAMRADFLATLIDRLACEVTTPPIVTALEALALGVGAELDPIDPSSDHRIAFAIGFRPALLLAQLVEVLHWQRPVAFQTQPNRNWFVTPFDCSPEPYRIGDWSFRPYLRGAPRARGGEPLPELERVGTATVVELVGCDTDINSIVIDPI